MRTMRITLVGGPHCGTDLHVGITERVVLQKNEEGGMSRYLRSERRDGENRQVFMICHNRTLQGLTPCDLG